MYRNVKIFCILATTFLLSKLEHSNFSMFLTSHGGGGARTLEILSPQNLILYLMALKFFRSDLALKRY